jgi:membrane associated rhomboid family serine protease
MGRVRFLAFYRVCGLLAAAAQVLSDPASPVPMVGASGAISGVLGAYLLMYPRVRIRMLFVIVIIIRVVRLPAWLVLLYWFALQVVGALPDVAGAQQTVPATVAVMAHIGGFLAGLALGKLFARRALVDAHLTGS